MDERAVTWASEADRRRDMRRMRWATFKSDVRMRAHGIFWKTLWALGLARAYSKATCWLNLYRKFPDGRCQYCGFKHATEATQDG